MVKLAKAGKTHGESKKMAPPPKEVEEDSEDEEMSEDEDDSSGEEEVVVPQKKGKKATTTPAKKVVVSQTKKAAVPTPAKKAAVTPGKKAAATPAKKAATPAKVVPTPGKKGAAQAKALVPTPGKKGAVTPAKGAKNGKNAKKEDSDEDEDEEDEDDSDEDEDDEEEDEFEPPVVKGVKPAKAAPASEDEDEEEEDDDEDDDEEEEDDSEEEVMEITPAKGKKAPAKVVPVKAKSVAEEDDDEEEDEDEEDDDEDEEDEDEEEEEEEEEEEPVKAAPGKRKKEMTKQKEAPDAKKQKVEGSEPTTPFNLFIGNLNPNKSVAELKVAISELFAKNDLAVVDVRTGTNRKFGYVDFESAEDLEKALELTGLKVFGNEIKLEKPKGRDSKKVRAARTLLAKNLSFNITEDELKEVFEDAMEIRLVSQDGKSKGIAYIEFKSEADAEKNLEEKQGAEIDGRSVSLFYTGEKGQRQERTGKNSTWSGESKTLVLSNLSYSATEETLQEVFEKATFIKVPQNPHGKSKGYAFIEFASFEDAKEALNSCNKMEIEGRAIRLELQGPRGSPNARSQPSKTLFVKGLSEDTTEETLKESFEGSVRARIVTDRETGSSKGFGFVDFNSEEDAKAAKEAMEDGEIDGNKVTLDWAKPKGEGGFGGRGGGRGGFGGRGGGRGGRGGFGGRGRGGFGGRGGFRGGRGGGGGDFKPQGKKTKFE
ncbi:nucleolin [Grammomys surdaster]|uniref:nucleolin n=1 Tax=Grammomys surdaster TaxID=491861 RepID=UPI00109FA710|nr:nucleolin [Grammomys surdaster]